MDGSRGVLQPGFIDLGALAAGESVRLNPADMAIDSDRHVVLPQFVAPPSIPYSIKATKLEDGTFRVVIPWSIQYRWTPQKTQASGIVVSDIIHYPLPWSRAASAIGKKVQIDDSVVMHHLGWKELMVTLRKRLHPEAFSASLREATFAKVAHGTRSLARGLYRFGENWMSERTRAPGWIMTGLILVSSAIFWPSALVYLTWAVSYAPPIHSAIEALWTRDPQRFSKPGRYVRPDERARSIAEDPRLEEVLSAPNQLPSYLLKRPSWLERRHATPLQASKNFLDSYLSERSRVPQFAMSIAVIAFGFVMKHYVGTVAFDPHAIFVASWAVGQVSTVHSFVEAFRMWRIGYPVSACLRRVTHPTSEKESEGPHRLGAKNLSIEQVRSWYGRVVPVAGKEPVSNAPATEVVEAPPAPAPSPAVPGVTGSAFGPQRPSLRFSPEVDL